MSVLSQPALTTQQRTELDRAHPTARDTKLGTRINDLESAQRNSDARQSMRLAAPLNIATLVGGASALIDGKTVAINDRVLAVSQSTGAQNGPYKVTALGSLWILFDAQTAAYTVGQKLTGGTSGATGIIAEIDDNGTEGALRLTNVLGEFADNETIADDGATPGSATSNGTLGDWKVDFDGQTANFTVGSNLTFSGGGVGRVVGLQDDGATGQAVLTRTSGSAPADDETLASDDSTPGDGDVNGDASDGATGTLVRADDDVTAGTQFFVSEGSLYADTLWGVTTDDDITLGTTSLSFEIIKQLGAVSQTFLAGAADQKGASSSSEVAFTTTYTVATEGLEVGQKYRVRANFKCADNNLTNTATIKAYLGTLDIAEVAAFDASDDDPAAIDVVVTIRALGPQGEVDVNGVAQSDAAGTVVSETVGAVAETVDLSSDPTFNFSVTWSASHADNKMDFRLLEVERIPAP